MKNNKLSLVNSILIILALSVLFNSKKVIAADLPGDSIYQAQSEWTTQSDKTLKISDFKGKFVIMSMIYMGCTSSCPMTVAKMKDVDKLLSEKAKNKTNFVLITFDLKRDTPAVMLKYANKNHLSLDRWTFLRSKEEANVREISNLIDFKYKSLPNGEFEHSFALVALDTEGRVIGRTEGSEMNPKAIADLINNKVAVTEEKKL